MLERAAHAGAPSPRRELDQRRLGDHGDPETGAVGGVGSAERADVGFDPAGDLRVSRQHLGGDLRLGARLEQERADAAVLEAGVAPIVHGVKGELPKAWVVLRAGATATPREIREFCKERLAPYKVPVAVAIVPDLPKSAVGKVLRRKLRELDVEAPAASAD